MIEDNNQPLVHAVKLIPTAEAAIKKQEHPWVFEDSLRKPLNGEAGDVCVLFGDRNNRVFGIGLLDPFSEIRIKMLHYGGPARLDKDFFGKRILSAYARRKPLLATDTNSYRLIFGENDGFPALIADVYARVLVVKVYSAIWFPYLDVLVDELQKVSGSDTVVLRLSRNVRPYTRRRDGEILRGTLEGEEVDFKEHGLLFTANVLKGHKTGYFLDHRHNRLRVNKLSKGKTVLDVFCYAGAFSVQAFAGGAREVTGVDVSAQALQVAKENVARIKDHPRFHALCGDAFQILQDLEIRKKTFDLVVIDPPSFAKSKQEVKGALAKYYSLAKAGAKLTGKGGMLILASCSSRVEKGEFFKTVEAGILAAGRKFRVTEKTGHDVDHPVNFPEGEYLKCAYYQLA